MRWADFDTCIVGQGLAGTTLAWTLHRQGNRVAIVDRCEPVSSSRIAAGLITPVTWQRFVKSWRFDEFWTAAVTFYHAIETETGAQLFNQRHAVRLFASRAERKSFLQKSDIDFPDLVRRLDNPVDETMFDAPQGGFEMLQSARLDVPCYLDVSREFFSSRGGYFVSDIDSDADLQLTDATVLIPKLGLRAKRLIFCQGFSEEIPSWFQTVPFDAVKGEILTLQIPELNESRVVHRGVWLAAIGNGLYRLGATYNREQLDMKTTTAAREELTSRLSEFLRVPFQVIDQHAAVRPVIPGRKPAVGLHPQFPQLGYFNGLGSKGSLQAPWFAQLFAAAMSGKIELASEFDVARYLNHQQ